MKPIIRYEADDGSVWGTPEEAAKRDALVVKCSAIVQDLGMRERPADPKCDYANGNGFLQQPTGTRDRLFEKLKALGANRDSDGPIGKLLYRVWCLDDRDREWGQSYFAIHPSKGKDIAL